MKIYEHVVRVIGEDLDELKHVNNVVYFKYLQEAAIAHWYSAAPRHVYESMRWVVKKHEIEYIKPAEEHDVLTVKTWIANLEGVKSLRFYEIYKAEALIVKASTLWVAIDPISMKPKRLAPEIMDFF